MPPAPAVPATGADPRGPGAKRALGFVGAIASLAAAGALLGHLCPALSRDQAVENRLWLCLFGIGYVLWRSIRPSPRRPGLRMFVLALVCTAGTVNYYRCEASTFTEVGDYYDITYYYLNAKYFDELGYYELYRAILLADEDNAQRLNRISTVRDLHDYLAKPRATVMQGTEALRARFTDARWEAFKHDADYVVRKKGASSLDYFFRDHGYNPPPTWTLVGGFFAKRVPVEHLKLITSIDILLVLGMFFVVIRTFGLEAALLGLLFMTATLSGRWPVLGQALLRFDWLAATVVAMCALRGGRPASAGALLAYASMSRIFPAVFFFPPLVVFLRDALKRRALPTAAVRFVVAAGAVTCAMVGGALITLGSQAFVDSAHNLAMHGSAESYSSLRVGLGDALIYRGERYWQLLHLTGSIPAKAEQLAALSPVTTGVGALVLLLIGVVCWRRRGATDTIIPLAYFVFFALTTPQINYHNSRLLLVLWHAQGTRPIRDTVGLCCLLAVEVMGIAAINEGAINYTMTSMSSVGLVVYCALMLASLALELRRNAAPAPAAARWRAPASAALALCVLTCAWLGYWNAGALPAAELRLPVSETSTIQPSGTRWPRDGGRAIDALGVLVELGRVHHDRRIDLSVDHDDRDRLLFLRDGKVVGRVDFRARGRVARGRLSRRRVKVPDGARARGYDAIRLVPLRGNRQFALGHLVPGRG